MNLLVIGFVSGAVSGVIMGLFSDVFFRKRMFRSSLFIIDGSFLFRTLKKTVSVQAIYGAGIVIHFITSGIFGAMYFFVCSLLGLDVSVVKSFTTIMVYVSLLWLSMLCIALPVAGEGLFGRKSGRFTWLEQLFLHAIFAVMYYGCTRILI